MAATTPALLDAFDSAIAEKVRPIFVSPGARHLIGESRFDGEHGPSSLQPKRHEELSGRFFWWINRFIVGSTTLDIGYGDRESLIEPMLFYTGIPDRFAPWELLSAAQVTDALVVSGEAWVLEPDFVNRVIARIADGLRQHWRILGKPAPQIIDRALVLRSQRILFAQEEQRRKDRDRASIHASAAFHAGDYAEAKRLLEPFRGDAELAPSAVKILELAEKRLK